MRQWPNDATVAHLIFVDHQEVPTVDVLDAAIAHARRKGARAVRTSALFPRAAAVVLDAGFRPIDELALLRMRLDDEVIDRLPAPRHRLRSMPTWAHHQAARTDQAAFGPLWGNDAASLRDIRRATPHHHARIVRLGGDIAGFAITGAAADNGYLQRVAVTPDRRRQGIACDLVGDSLRWMHEQRRSHALVNTGVGNDAALALYASFGFERLDDGLTIAERRLTG